MSIQFHCEHCGKKIEAPDSVGGRRGKCPACRNPIYIPAPPVQEDEPLRLAPLDDYEEQRRKRLLSETFELAQNIIEERAVPDETPPDEPNIASDDMSYLEPISVMNPQELKKTIVQYLRLMADGALEEAEQIAEYIAPQGRAARDVLDKIAMSDLPEPELARVPPHVLAGMIRDLRGRIA